MSLSIIMAIHNEQDFIVESINSILIQDYQNFELIIIDDGSIDDTSKLVNNFLKDKRITYINNGKIGKVEAFNIGYKMSKKNFICFFHGDDIMRKKGIISRFNYIKGINDIPVAVAGKLETKSTIKAYNSIIIPKGKRASFSGQSIMFNRKLADKIFPIPKDLPNEDYWMRLHIECFAKKIFHSSKIIADYRIHENNSFLSTSSIKNFKIKSKRIHLRRTIVASKFIAKYRNVLPKKNIYKLESEIIAEGHRYKGNLFKLLMTNIGFKKKISFLFESNQIFYKIKNLYPRLFMGLG